MLVTNDQKSSVVIALKYGIILISERSEVWIPYSIIVETFQVLATVSDTYTLWYIRWCESVYLLNLVFGFCPLVQPWRRKEGKLHPCFLIVKFPWSIEVAHILLFFLTPSQWSLQVVMLTLQSGWCLSFPLSPQWKHTSGTRHLIPNGLCHQRNPRNKGPILVLLLFVFAVLD